MLYIHIYIYIYIYALYRWDKPGCRGAHHSCTPPSGGQGILISSLLQLLSEIVIGLTVKQVQIKVGLRQLVGRVSLLDVNQESPQVRRDFYCVSQEPETHWMLAFE